MYIQYFRYSFSWLFFTLIILSIFACRRDNFYEGSDIKLTFSADTLRFDTVFTKIGSATRFVKIFNPESQPVKVNILLGNPELSVFRFNVEGVKGPSAKEIEINGKDSIYVFIEVTINPDQPLSVSPFIIEDKLTVEVNGNKEIIYLEAFGQNANYIPGINKGAVSLLSCNGGEVIWNDPKPYVVYGILYIDSCRLVLPPGTKIYVHGGIVRTKESLYNDGLIVCLQNGRIISQGSVEQPVYIQGDRLEPSYSDVKNQWVGILFSPLSRGNVLNNTTIKNSIIGVQVDSLAQLTMSGCRIYNTGNSGIIGRFGEIFADNCLVYNNDGQGVSLRHGGRYQFQYCTITSYVGRSAAVSMNNYFCYEFPCQQAFINPLDALFVNCIIAGGNEDEIEIDYVGDRSTLFYQFENSVVRVNELLDKNNHPDFFTYAPDCYNYKFGEKLFLDQSKNDYRLDTMSVALGKARPIFIKKDIEGKTRKDTNPDPGCFEF
ncbi:MAG: right-handed parallel beta-helix repeat-containing protein [Saprospiraceae bacterium]|nr:right-handed parallel beta-helix repeat-containing protein [Saprospiraceae bacterium]